MRNELLTSDLISVCKMDSPYEQGKFNLYEVVNKHNEPIMVFGGVASTEEVSTVSDIVIYTLTDTESEN